MEPLSKTEAMTPAHEFLQELLKLGVRLTTTWALSQLIIDRKSVV